MAQALTRALALFALASPAFAAGLPDHPPAPPPRPAFPSDAPELAPGADQSSAEQPSVVELRPSVDPAAPADVAPPAQARIEPPPPPPAPPPAPFKPRPDTAAALDPDGFTAAEKAGLADLTRKYAARHGVPLELLHRVIMRESKYHPGIVHHRYYGLMQITHATARGMGYKGGAKGLLDAETNLAYATPYLANAWALAGGDMNRAVRLYAAGYYNTAKSKGMLREMRDAHSPPVKPEAPQETPTLASPPQQQTGFFDSLFDR
ncbi:soluble lytic murein transglycosylase-like protein [Rhodoblastus acidophilus]|uniref:lytic transglycosylase domain-containing protein n=1 Tax=Rhodoblastus acidophilus TaxID=1074 RepID=UPI00161AE84C|nr:lytic transglycosylase domain-containing protein [Rhodoblastus acidophilus]MCW2284742.1 soluble lytic murein transglycosylase-like protein [Rhodoblastus acidophilus]MCW2333695.1 soluble lytic murein transglycosylase-like protein [Rhodoblastus acidophilus]